MLRVNEPTDDDDDNIWTFPEPLHGPPSSSPSRCRHSSDGGQFLYYCPCFVHEYLFYFCCFVNHPTLRNFLCNYS